jgi:hypothetical protein
MDGSPMRLVLGICLATLIAAPAALAAEKPLRLSLSPADTDRDGVVTQDETAAYLVKTSGPAVEIMRPRSAVFEPPPGPLPPGPLELERRIVPASDFEKANDYVARKTERKRR